jgi:hypothetical protein
VEATPGLTFHFVGGALVLVGFASFVVTAVRAIGAGRGVPYVAGGGAKVSYISTLAFFALLPIILGAAWLWSRRSRS